MLPGILSAALLVSFLPQIDSAVPQGRLRGHVVDAGGAAISATVRVIRPDTNAVVFQLGAKEDGTFETGPLAPGVYSFTAYRLGFHRRELQQIVIKAGRVADIGQVRLDISGCDTPGTSCTYISGCGTPDTNCELFGVPDDVKRITAKSHVTLKPPCAVDLDRKGEMICPGLEGGVLSAPDSDLQLIKENGTLYLAAVNGASLSKPYAATLDCSGVTFGNGRIGVVGLGEGVDFCVQTKRGSISHVFFTIDIDEKSTIVALWYVTRKRR